uniref:Sodium/bile acid cotransporter 7 (Trinotate prediction) n=1 Tax=Myxobolus squamalis TaxID=59785 RepID=A0A6B2FX25_MYXSQ
MENMRFPVFAFLFGLFIVISLSFIFPSFATSDFPLYPKITTKLAIFLIFTISGLKIPFDDLRQNILSVKIMFFSLLCTFIFYPIAGVSIGYLMYMVGVPWEITRGFVVLQKRFTLGGHLYAAPGISRDNCYGYILWRRSVSSHYFSYW